MTTRMISLCGGVFWFKIHDLLQSTCMCVEPERFDGRVTAYAFVRNPISFHSMGAAQEVHEETVDSVCVCVGAGVCVCVCAGAYLLCAGIL